MGGWAGRVGVVIGWDPGCVKDLNRPCPPAALYRGVELRAQHVYIKGLRVGLASGLADRVPKLERINQSFS